MATAHRDWCVSVNGKIIYTGTLAKANAVFNSVTDALSIVGLSDVPVVLYRSAYAVVDSEAMVI